MKKYLLAALAPLLIVSVSSAVLARPVCEIGVWKGKHSTDAALLLIAEADGDFTSAGVDVRFVENLERDVAVGQVTRGFLCGHLWTSSGWPTMEQTMVGHPTTNESNGLPLAVNFPQGRPVTWEDVADVVARNPKAYRGVVKKGGLQDLIMLEELMREVAPTLLKKYAIRLEDTEFYKSPLEMDGSTGRLIRMIKDPSPSMTPGYMPLVAMAASANGFGLLRPIGASVSTQFRPVTGLMVSRRNATGLVDCRGPLKNDSVPECVIRAVAQVSMNKASLLRAGLKDPGSPAYKRVLEFYKKQATEYGFFDKDGKPGRYQKEFMGVSYGSGAPPSLEGLALLSLVDLRQALSEGPASDDDAAKTISVILGKLLKRSLTKGEVCRYYNPNFKPCTVAK